MFEKSLETLTADIGRWADKEVALRLKQREVAGRISDAELAAGAALLDDVPTTASLRDLERARAELSATVAAIAACRSRRIEAIKTKRAAEAAALRKRAGEVRGQAEQLEAKVGERSAAIAELLGVCRIQVIPVLERPESDPPRPQALRAEIRSLEAQAEQLEGEVPRNGGVDVPGAVSTDPLITAVLRVEAEAPPVEAVLEWAARCEGAHGFGDAPRRFYLVWRDGKINAEESFTHVPSLVRSSSGYAGGLTYESGSDVFRAGMGR